MSDIVGRLKTMSACCRLYGVHNIAPIAEAADEIARLRARIAEKDEALRECVYWMQFREKRVPGVDNISDRARKALEG